jgi:phosphoglycerol transferase
VILSTIILVLVLRLWRADLRVPLDYTGDGLLYQTLIKSTLEHGWYLHNDRLGLPDGLDLRDFPLADGLHLLLIKVLGWFWPDFGVAFNLFFLLTFPLTTLSALFVCRRLGCAYPVALVASLLFTFLPYHCFRIHHLFLASYYLVPLQMWLAVRLYLQDNPFRRGRWLSALGAVTICLLSGAGGVYYALFSCFFLLVAALTSWYATRARTTLWTGAVLIGLIGLSLALTLSPSLLHRWRAGTNPDAVPRNSFDAEIHGLKVTQLLLPVTGHLVPWLKVLKRGYNHPGRPLIAENDMSSLGMIGSIGFLYLVGRCFLRRRAAGRLRLQDGLALLTLAALLLASIGSFGSLFSYLVTPLIRGFNRISVFIAFFALLAVAALFQRLWQSCPARSRRRSFVYLLLAGGLMFGLLDQTSLTFVPPYRKQKQDFLSDSSFVQQLEARLPPQTPIYQLPVLPFPEHITPHGYICYDLLRPYLHSGQLRWSYGTLRGQDCDDWRRQMARKPVGELVPTLAVAGFGGIYVDRAGYEDHGVAVERQLAQLLDVGPLVSANQRLAFYDLTAYARQVRRGYTAQAWERDRQRRFHPVTATWRTGCCPLDEWAAQGHTRWCGTQGEFFLRNPLDHARTITLRMKCLPLNVYKTTRLIFDSELFGVDVQLGKQGQTITQTVVVPPGRHRIAFHCDPPGFDQPAAFGIKVAFQVVNFTLSEQQ